MLAIYRYMSQMHPPYLVSAPLVSGTIRRDRLSAPARQSPQGVTSAVRRPNKFDAVTRSGQGRNEADRGKGRKAMAYKRWQGPIRPDANGASPIHLRLVADEDAPGRARAALAALASKAGRDVLERATLLISELVTNSVEHSGSREVRVDLWSVAGSLVVVVSDDGEGFTPVPRPGRAADYDSGFGLPLLDTLAHAWGSGSDEGSWVWFQVVPRIEPAVPAPDEILETEPGDRQLLDVRMVVDSVEDHAVVALDTGGNITNWGSPAVRLTGWTADEMLGSRLSDLFDIGEDDTDVAVAEGRHHIDRWILRKDGSKFWAEVALAPIIDRSGKLRGFSSVLSDATDRKHSDDARDLLIADLRDLALTDDLTGLANRRRWAEDLRRELARARRHDTPLAVAMLDLDHFKEFNDSRGHLAGDALLRDVARRWSEAVRATDLLARYGGDEFSITLPECPPELALTVIQRVQEALPSEIGASAGLASLEDGETATSLVARADAALYQAKRLPESVVFAGLT